MENTPLELYETAYNLHYSEHRIPDSIIYYQRLIKDFPESNECGYAVIQLQKIKASEIAADLHDMTAPGKSSNKLMYGSLTIACLLLLAMGYFYYHFNELLVAEQMRTSLAFNALSKISRGNHDDALILLNSLKEFKKEDITPYELCADIYRKENNFNLARNEYTIFFQLNPMLQPSKNEKWFMDLNDSQKNRPVVSLKPQQSIEPPQPPPPTTPITTKKTTAPRGKKKGPAQKPPPPGKSGSGLYLVDPDSLSYF